MNLNNTSDQTFVVDITVAREVAFNGDSMVAPVRWRKGQRRMKPEPGALVILLAGHVIVGCGYVNNWHYDQHLQTSQTWVQFSIRWSTHPMPLDDMQVSLVEDAARAARQAEDRLAEVVCLADGAWRYFRDCQYVPAVPDESIRYTADWFRAQRKALLDRDDLEWGSIFYQLKALDGQGPLAALAYYRDSCHWASCIIDLDETRPYPIVPWDVAPDDVRTDSENYIHLNEGFAANFLRGMLTFDADGGVRVSCAMSDEMAFSFGMDLSFYLPKPSARQLRYLAFHAEHVLDSWRSPGVALPRFGEVGEAAWVCGS